MPFADLLSLHLVTFSMFFILVRLMGEKDGVLTKPEGQRSIEFSLRQEAVDVGQGPCACGIINIPWV